MDVTVRRNAVELAVRDFGGSGTPVLLLPGGGGTVVDLSLLARQLLPRHRVLAMDLRNHGRSGDGEWTWDAVVEDVRAVVQQVGLDRPVIAGHSLGGMVAALYLDRYDDLTAAVNLDGHGPGRPEHYDMKPAEATRLLAEQQAVLELQTKAALGPHPLALLDVLQAQAQTQAEHFGATAAEGREALHRKVVQHDDGTFGLRPVPARAEQVREHVEQLDLLALYRRVRGQLLVVNAVAPDPTDRTGLMAAHRRGLRVALAAVAREHPNVRVLEVDATHALIWEQPELLAQEISAFAAEGALS